MKRARPQKGSGQESSENVPSIEEAQRVASYIVTDELTKIADAYPATMEADTAGPLRQLLALTIAVTIVVERLYRLVGTKFPDQWSSLESSARSLTDKLFLKLWDVGKDGQRALKRQRKRRLERRAGTLVLVESQRDTHARWAVVTLPDDVPVPLASEVTDGLPQTASAFETRIQDCLEATPLPVGPTGALLLSGQIMGLLCAAEFLLSVFPAHLDLVAAFCVRIATIQVAHEAERDKEES